MAGLPVWLPRALLLVLLLTIGVFAVRRTTWYLSVDQFGFLTFAHDLAQGQIGTTFEPQRLLHGSLPSDKPIDFLAQTYVQRGEALYSRYPPGFPLVLALVGKILGEAAQHYVTAAALLLLLVCLYVLASRVLGSEWLGLSVALLVALQPNYVLMWATSPLRDLPAHLLALTSLTLLLPAPDRGATWRRRGLAALLLGFAMTMRVDAMLYLLPAAGLGFLSRPWPRAHLAAAALGFALGIAPLLAYNGIAMGNPFVPTQSMEMEGMISNAPAPQRWLMRVMPGPAEAQAAENAAISDRSAPELQQGGGLNLGHLRTTLPGNLERIRHALGDLGLALALVGMIAAVAQPALFVLTVPYCAAALIFFSLWAHPDQRYLLGVFLLAALAEARGILALAALPARMSNRSGRIALAFLLAATVLWLLGSPKSSESTALPYVNVVVAGACIVGLARTAFGRSPGRLLVPALVAGLTVILLWRSIPALGTRSRFQAPEVARAKTTIESTLQLPAVVFTTSDIGRPAENINYYTGVDAIYMQEIHRWNIHPIHIANRLMRAGTSVYLLLTPWQARKFIDDRNVERFFAAETVATIAPEHSADFFVALPGYVGAPIELVRLRLRDKPLSAAPPAGSD